MTDTSTYKELVHRYRIMCHEDLPERHKEEYRNGGINPDELWSLIWSFKNKEDAEKCLADCIDDAPTFWTYKLVDAGQEEIIERSIW